MILRSVMDSAARALLCVLGAAAFSIPARGAPAKARAHTVVFGAARRVPYSAEGDPAGNNGDEKELRVRPLLVDGKVKEWTTGDAHDVTERSVAVRRALRINDSLPGDSLAGGSLSGGARPGEALPGDRAGKGERWVWQRGPWLLVDRSSGRVAALRLPDFDPAVSEVAWFRDFAAYCGLSAGGKQLYAVVAQVAGRKPLLMKKISAWDLADHPTPACGPATWQREPLRVTFAPTKAGPPVSYELVGLSAVLVEDGDESDGPE
jgi:hypothetical protein